MSSRSDHIITDQTFSLRWESAEDWLVLQPALSAGIRVVHFVGLAHIQPKSGPDLLGQHCTNRHWNRVVSSAINLATKQDVGALLDTSVGWGVYGKPARASRYSSRLFAAFTPSVWSAASAKKCGGAMIQIGTVSAGGRLTKSKG
jgi:hypothetical protein